MLSKTGTIFIDPPREENLPDDREVESLGGGELDDLVQRASWIIYECTSRTSIFYPFKDKLTICPNRVTITKKGLFTLDEYPMPIENLTSARVYAHLNSASLIVETFGIERPEPLKNLNVNEARVARRYIQALVECKKNEINLSQLSLSELREKLKNMGIVQYSTDEKDYHKI